MTIYTIKNRTKYICPIHGKLEEETIDVSIPLRGIETSFCILCFVDLLKGFLPGLEEIEEEPE